MASPRQPLILELIDAFNADIFRGEEQAFARMVDAWLLVEQALRSEIELTVIEIAGLETLNREIIFDNRRLQSLLLQVEDQITAFSEGVAEPIVRQRQSQLAADAIEHADLSIRAIAAERQIDIAFDRLPIRAVQNLVGISGDGSPLVDTLTRSHNEASRGIILELIDGLTIGRNPQETANRIVSDGLSSSLSHMMTVARTESLRSYREVSRRAYQESNVVDAWIRIETLDTRVCPGCLAAHGTIHSLDEEFKAHPNCRGTSIPSMKGFELDFPDGEQWFNSLSDIDQLEIMGPGRMNYLSDGGLFSRLSTERESATWGNSIVPRPVHQL